jgi:hypothetical protein
MQENNYTVDKNCDPDAVSWRKAIEHAGIKIEGHKRRIRELRRSIRLMNEQIKAGEPWPGTKR